MYYNFRENSFQYNEYMPCPRLRAYISSYWHFNFFGMQGQKFSILPDGCFDLIIVTKNRDIVDVNLTGLWDQKISVQYDESIEVFAIRFKTTAVGELIGFRIGEFLNGMTSFELQDFGFSIESIENILGSNPEMIFQYFNDQFLKMLERKPYTNRVRPVLELIDRSQGMMPINEIAESLSLSSRQIQRIIKESIGLSPKKYSKIIRFRENLKEDSLHGYFDQSHFLKDFKEFACETPKEAKHFDNVRILQYKYFK